MPGFGGEPLRAGAIIPSTGRQLKHWIGHHLSKAIEKPPLMVREDRALINKALNETKVACRGFPRG